LVENIKTIFFAALIAIGVRTVAGMNRSTFHRAA